MINQSGHRRRKPSDNLVIKSGGPVRYLDKVVHYDSELATWTLNGKPVGSLSNLSKALKLNVETHDIGFYLEKSGYVFKTLFE